uniref:Cytochrome P450, family 17, subfamily A, polypeptide 2 n=1 Tax=Labrus bergylta TaxID=56723 RepID=A0A3Q3NRT8_9LABR
MLHKAGKRPYSLLCYKRAGKRPYSLLCYKKYGSLFALYLGPHYTVVVNNHQHAREVLLQRGRDFAGRPSMVTTDLLTRGGKDIAFSDYSPLWKSHRRLVHNSFTLLGRERAVDSLCVELMSAGCRGFDPSPAVTRAVTNVVCQLLIQYNNGIVQTITRGGLVDIFPWMKVPSLTSIWVLGKSESGRGQKSPGSEEERITDDHVLMTAAEAFGAGVETTSTTLLWILAYLLHHPEVRTERPVCMSDRSRLPYLDCVINEGMRIRPVSPVLIPHTAMTDSSIGGHSVSRGTRVLVNMWAIHHEPRHWDKPDLFNPDRFLDNQGQRVTPSYFLPFGAGPRVCVGESLARLELFLFLSSMLQRISFSLPEGAPPPNLQGRLGVVLQPLPYKVVVAPRAGLGGRIQL